MESVQLREQSWDRCSRMSIQKPQPGHWKWCSMLNTAFLDIVRVLAARLRVLLCCSVLEM